MHCVATWSSIRMLQKYLSPGVKRPEYGDNTSPAFSAELKKYWSYTSTVIYVIVMCKRKNILLRSLRKIWRPLTGYAAQRSKIETNSSTECANSNSSLFTSRFHWPRSLRGRSGVTCLLGLWVRTPPGAWLSVFCFVLSGKGLCDWPITHPEEFYRVWCV